MSGGLFCCLRAQQVFAYRWAFLEARGGNLAAFDRSLRVHDCFLMLPSYKAVNNARSKLNTQTVKSDSLQRDICADAEIVTTQTRSLWSPSTIYFTHFT